MKAIAFTIGRMALGLFVFLGAIMCWRDQAYISSILISLAVVLITYPRSLVPMLTPRNRGIGAVICLLISVAFLPESFNVFR